MEFFWLLNYLMGKTHLMVTRPQGLKRQNFVVFLPKQAFIRAEIHVPNSEDWYKKLEEANFKVNSIGKKGRLKFRISKENINKERELLKDILNESYNGWIG